MSTAKDVKDVAKYAAQYDGPTEFTGKYIIVFKVDGKTVNPDKSTVLFKMVYFTDDGKRETVPPFETLPIKITEATFNKKCTAVESFKFQAKDWYPNIDAFVLVNAGLAGQVDFKKKTGNWKAKYQDKDNAAITIYEITGKVK